MVHTRRVTALIVTLSCIFLVSNGCSAGEEDQEKGKGLLWAAVGAVIGLKDTHPWIFSMLVGFVAVGVLILGSHVVIKRVPLDDGTKSPVTFLKLIHRFFGIKGKGRTICNLVLAAIIFVLAFTVSRACIGGEAEDVVVKLDETVETAETAETVAVPEPVEPPPTAEVTPGEAKVPGSKKEMVEVPKVTGLNWPAAERLLQSKRLKAKLVEKQENGIVPGKVIGQRPALDTFVERNATVTVDVCIGPKTCTNPDCVDVRLRLGTACPHCGREYKWWEGP